MFKMFYTYFYVLGGRLYNTQSVLFLSKSEFQADELNGFKIYLTVKAEETISGVCGFHFSLYQPPPPSYLYLQLLL